MFYYAAMLLSYKVQLKRTVHKLSLPTTCYQLCGSHKWQSHPHSFFWCGFLLSLGTPLLIDLNIAPGNKSWHLLTNRMTKYKLKARNMFLIIGKPLYIHVCQTAQTISKLMITQDSNEAVYKQNILLCYREFWKITDLLHYFIYVQRSQNWIKNIFLTPQSEKGSWGNGVYLHNIHKYGMEYSSSSFCLIQVTTHSKHSFRGWFSLTNRVLPSLMWLRYYSGSNMSLKYLLG